MIQQKQTTNTRKIQVTSGGSKVTFHRSAPTLFNQQLNQTLDDLKSPVNFTGNLIISNHKFAIFM